MKRIHLLIVVLGICSSVLGQGKFKEIPGFYAEYPWNVYWDNGWKYSGDGPAAYFKIGDWNIKSDYVFYVAPVNNAGAGQEAPFNEVIRFAQTGNVGIGAENPLEKLDVRGNISLDRNRYILFGGTVATTGEYIYEKPAGVINIHAGGADALVMSNNSNVYLNPDAGSLGVGTRSIDNAQGWSKVVDVFGTYAKLLVRSTNVKTGIFSHDTWNGITAGRIGTESLHPLILTAGYGNDVMCLTTDSKVGIGTTTPTEKLAVNGNIRSKKVIVTQTNWPDYVFDSSYQLPSLDSVSTFIQTNKHLPDMPSAATVEKDGHDLGEVQKLLLKKMEEMTLYMIELKKQNELILQENKQLKSRIEKMENK